MSLNLTDPVRIRNAYQQAHVYSADVIVERFYSGIWHRLLVVGGEMIAAVRCVSPRVVGDGVRSIAALIEDRNAEPRLADPSTFPIEPLRVGAIELAVLYRQGLGLDSVPAAGQTILLREDAYLSHGATQNDMTEQVHSEVAALAVDAVAVVGLDIAGVDLVSTDISRPVAEQDIAVLEVNAEPAIVLHLAPLNVPPRPVAESILRMLFPPEKSGRIPHIGVIGCPELARSLEKHLGEIGVTVGLVGVRDASIGGAALRHSNTRQADRLRGLWTHPRIEAVILDLTFAEIVEAGLPYDRFDVVFVASLDELSVVTRGREQMELLREAWQLILSTAEHGGTALCVDGEASGPSDLFGRIPTTARVLGHSPEQPWVTRHLARGGHLVRQSLAVNSVASESAFHSWAKEVAAKTIDTWRRCPCGSARIADLGEAAVS